MLPAVIYKLNCKHTTLSKCYLKVCVKFSSVRKFSYDLACGFLSLQVKSFLGTQSKLSLLRREYLKEDFEEVVDEVQLV